MDTSNKGITTRFIKAIDQISVETGRNIKDLCEDLGFSAGYVTNLRRKPQSIGSAILVSLYHKHKINPVWILLGEGEMIVSKKQRSINDILSSLEAKTDHNLELMDKIITKMLEAIISVNILPKDAQKQLAQKGFKKTN